MELKVKTQFTDGKISLSGNRAHREKPKFADYVLYTETNYPIAVVEAKDNKHTATYGLQQAMDYAVKLDIPFAYSSNGDYFVEHDFLTGQERNIPLAAFPGKPELLARLARAKGEAPSVKYFTPEQDIIKQPYYSGQNTNTPRYYQRIAINRTINAVANGQNRILLVMATGTGKTYTAFQIIYRLLKSGMKRKILYLADRNTLVDQSIEQDFKPLERQIHKINFRKAIKDLKFPTLEFANDSSGKLLLNIMFAMSKQYSEHLSESVQRGVDSNFAQSKSSGVPKWGYNRDEATGLYRPDENFDHIRHAWDMVIAGATRTEALEYLNAHDVHRMTKLTRKNKHPRRMDIGEHAMTTIFRDPFYYGMLAQADQGIELKKVDPNFKPIVTEQEFNMVQAQTKERSRREITYFEPLRASEKLFLPFRHLFLCHECGHYMVVSRSRGRRGKYYMNVRCMYEGCTRNPKGIDELTEINEKIVDPAKLKLTAENLLNPLNSLGLQMRAADMLQMDVLARKIFLNLEIDQQKTILYRYKESFQSLISGQNLGQVSFGEPIKA